MLKIFMGDLSYDTITLSNEGFPINVGYISAYCLQRFHDKIDITIFKYIKDLEEQLYTNPPDVLGLSNYAWNHRIGLEMFKLLLRNNPDAITVCGGANFPADAPSQEKFMQLHPEIDVYVPFEGEIGFTKLVEQVLEINDNHIAKRIIANLKMEGCVTRNDGKIQFGIPVIRMRTLDEIPSPYLSGLMDKFFDGKLSPMIQTNRGCPFTCTFCVDGSDEVMKVNNFSMERVRAELEYIGKHVPKETSSMIISDLNFGMFKRDLQICDCIADIQDRYDYPTEIQATTGKNSKEKIIANIKRLRKGTLRLWMSVQSLDEQVLKSVKRDNISVDEIMELNSTIKDADLGTRSEVILALPSETYQSHINTLRELVRAKLEHIDSYTLMLVDGSELCTPKERIKWNFLTKFRIIPRDFVKLMTGKVVTEIEEVVVGTNTLSFDEYIKLRMLAFSIYITNIGVVFQPLLKYLREKEIDIFELFYRTLINLNSAPENIQKVFQKFKNSTVNELWDSPEEIENHYQIEKNYQKLLTGETGINVIQFYYAGIASRYMMDLTQYLNDISFKLMKEADRLTTITESQLNNILTYCRCISFNPLGKDRMKTNPTNEFDYDIVEWLKNEKPLEDFKLNKPVKLTFQLDEEQYSLIENKLKIFGNSDVGLAQTIKRIPMEKLWRNGDRTD